MTDVRTSTLLLPAVLWVLLASPGHAEAPFTPASDDEIVATLPDQWMDPGLLEQQQRQRARPDDVVLAVELAERLVRIGRRTADPRYYGYAQAALSHWWQDADAPVPILMLRATIMQNRHQFVAALADLHKVLQLQPGNGQAWLTRATIETVVGRPDLSLQSCHRLGRLHTGLLLDGCLANAMSLLGQAEPAFARLQASLARHRAAAPEARVFALTLAAQIAAQLGDQDSATALFREATALDSRDAYLLTAYADHLLDAGQSGAVLDLLAGQEALDPLLLRMALAEQGLSRAGERTTVPRYLSLLRERVDALQARQDETHLGLLARYHLAFGSPARALALAQQNWEDQREPVDARVLLEAALATGDRNAARPVRDWIARTGIQHQKLARLLTRLSP